MSKHATDVQESGQECYPSVRLPADHVLNSGAVLFPGAFDQHGCPLVVFPVDGQAKLSSKLSKAEVVDFINYFLCLHNKKQEKEILVSVVADLRHALLPASRFIAEILLLLELHKRTLHTVYIIQPENKDVLKLLLKLLTPSKDYSASFKKVFLKEISELSNYIDRSQLTAQLGGYLIYCHQSWVAFFKEIDVFVKEFLSVVQRLPSCISVLHALSRLPLPSTFRELQHFCSTNEAKFQQLRRELGLDELLRHCESVLEKLRYPEKEPSYQAMAGTVLFTHTTFDMLQNHSRITAAVEKVELLWQQAFSKAWFQLHVLQLQEDALQITEQIKTLHQEKLQPYKIEIAKDAAKAVVLVSEFEVSIYTPAMVLIHCAEDVINTVAEILPSDGQTREWWLLDLENLKQRLYSTVHFILQTLRAVSNYHHSYNKASSWYKVVLYGNFLQDMLSVVNGDGILTQRQRRNWDTIPAWKCKVSTFLKENPPPDMEDLVPLVCLSNLIPDNEVQQAGKQMFHRCMTLRKLLISSGPMAVGHLQLALQWQYDFLRNSHINHSSADSATTIEIKDVKDLTRCESAKEAIHVLGTFPSTAVSGIVSTEGKPSTVSSFDSGFDGAGSSQLEARGGREGVEGLSRLTGTRDSVIPVLSQPQIHKEKICSSPDYGDHRVEFDFCSVGNNPRASIKISPKVNESLNFEIRVKRSAALPSNPWLSLPVDDSGNTYTVTITQNPTPHNRDLLFHDPSDTCSTANQFRFRAEVENSCQDQLTQTFNSTQSLLCDPLSQSIDWIMHSQSSLEDPELSPICNILSSTITDERDESICTTEGIPTLLWDSYDLHDQKQDFVDGLIDISLIDWDVKEQEGLREVEKILERADEILEKEENVLAQEAELDALLSSEDQNHRSLWATEDQLAGMSSGELAEAGVIGLEDYVVFAESDDLSELKSAVFASEATSDNDSHCPEAATNTVPLHSRLNLLTELRKVYVLDQLIMEENLKIHMLRHCKEKTNEELTEGKHSDTHKLSSMSKDMEAFHLQLEKEKREVDKLETSLVPVNAQVQDTWKTQHIPAAMIPDVAKEATPQNVAQLSDSQCQGQPEPSVLNTSTSDLKEPLGGVGIQPQPFVFVKECDIFGENAIISEPAPYMTLETKFQPTNQDTGIVQPDLQEKPLQLLPDTSSSSHNLVLNAHVKAHSNNNNNCVLPEKYKLTTDHLSEGASVIPACLLVTDLINECPHQQSLPELPPGQCLKFDPCGGDELKEDLPGGVQSSEAMRISNSGIQAQFHTDTREVTDFKTPIVLDTGSSLMKAGFADQDLPNVTYPTIIGMPKYEEIINGNFERDTYIGHEAQHMRGVLVLKHPIKNGVIRNWDEMEKIWHHTFQQLCVDPEDHPVLLTEAAMNPLENRQHMVEIMFESFSVPFTYVAMQAVLALYAAGRSTGLVFDSGDGVSHSVPVFDGYCLPHAVQRFPLAGVDITMHLKKLLQEQGVCMSSTAEMEIVREMKEKCCCVALNYEAELNAGGKSCRQMHYTMPDGQIVTLNTERFRAPEILFKPEMIGQDHYGMHESVLKSIFSSDIDLRRCFLGNIVLSGGNTLLAGLSERLRVEIKGLLSTDMGESVCVTSPKDRDSSVWCGGAVLANLPSFSSAWISQEEYEEYGPQIVFRKCF